jgi:hypothetical protein
VADGQLCFAGAESGTVGFWYNVEQAQGQGVESFTPAPLVGGINLNIATVGSYEIHFYADETLYCSGVLDQSVAYFLWGSFRQCDDLLVSYDAQTPFTTVRFTTIVNGSFEVCLSQLESLAGNGGT